MKAIILAAGYATRLYPLTLDQPKPLLNVAGKPMLEHIMDKLSKFQELNEIFVVTNDKFSTHFEEWERNLEFHKKVTVVNDGTKSDQERLGPLGDIKFVIDKHDVDDDLLIFGGDNLFEENLSDLHSVFKEKNRSVVGFNDVGCTEIAKKMGVGALDHNQRITHFVEKPEQPPSTLASTLIYFLKQEDVHEIHEVLNQRGKDREVKAGELIEHLISSREVHGYVLKKRWFDIGSHDQLKEADEFFSRRLEKND